MKRILSILLTIFMILGLSACKKAKDLISDVQSSSVVNVNQEEDLVSETESVDSQLGDVSQNSTTTSITQPQVESTPKTESAVASEKTPSETASEQAAIDNGKLMREKMNGTWRCVYPAGTFSLEDFRIPDRVYVFDITISSGVDVVISEKEYYRTDTETWGEEAYFNGERYILANDSAKLTGAFAGQIFTTIGRENEAEISIRDYEPFTYRYFVNETHFLTLIDDTHMQWTRSETGTQYFEDGYFPWNTSTVFTKQ